MKAITIRIWVPDTTPDPVLGDHGTLAPDVVALLASQPDATRYLMTDEDIAKAADGNAQREYYSTVRGFVEELKSEIKAGNITDEDGAREWLEQSIDGCHDVIYTYAAQEVLRHSKNDQAYFDDFGTEGAIDDSGIQWSKLAYCALLADVYEELGDISELFEADEDEETEDAEDDADDKV